MGIRIGIITALMNNYGSRLQNIATVELVKRRFPNAAIETIVLSSRFSRPSKLYRLLNNPVCRKILLSVKFRSKINKNNRLLNFRPTLFVDTFDFKTATPRTLNLLVLQCKPKRNDNNNYG